MGNRFSPAWRRAVSAAVAICVAAGLLSAATAPAASAADPVTVRRVDSKAVVTPDSTGRVTVPFCPAAEPCMFSRVPDAVVVTGSLPSTATLPVNLVAYSATTTAFTLRALNQTGAPITRQIEVYYHASLSGAGPDEESSTVTATTDSAGRATVAWAAEHSSAPVSVVASGVSPTGGGGMPVSMVVTGQSATGFTIRALDQNGDTIASRALTLAYLGSWQARSQPVSTWTNVNATIDVTTDASGYALVTYAQPLFVAPGGIQVTGVAPTSGAGIPASLVANNASTTGFRVRVLDGDGVAVAGRGVTISYHAATGSAGGDYRPSNPAKPLTASITCDSDANKISTRLVGDLTPNYAYQMEFVVQYGSHVTADGAIGLNEEKGDSLATVPVLAGMDGSVSVDGYTRNWQADDYAFYTETVRVKMRRMSDGAEITYREATCTHDLRTTVALECDQQAHTITARTTGVNYAAGKTVLVEYLHSSTGQATADALRFTGSYVPPSGTPHSALASESGTWSDVGYATTINDDPYYLDERVKVVVRDPLSTVVIGQGAATCIYADQGA